MAAPRKLKVYRTPIGFHDAYVAAPSQKAALAAWGSSHDLFARGVAEQVEDPALMAEPLAHPGEVIRRSRGSTAEQLAALPDTPKPPRRAKRPAREARPRAGPAQPPPSRAALDAAEAALSALDRRQAEEERAIAAAEAELVARRRALANQSRAERTQLERARAEAARAYDAALARWRD